MTSTEILGRIAELARGGASQREICDHLGISRGQCQHYRAKLGLLANKNGPKSPRIQKRTEARILELLANGCSQRDVARKLRVREWAVRQVAERNQFRRLTVEERLDSRVRQNLIDEIKVRADYARNLAGKYNVPYKVVLRLAREIHCARKFYPGRGLAPLQIPLVRALP